jgi:thioredoxin-like negative regulator of GroEL
MVVGNLVFNFVLTPDMEGESEERRIARLEQQAREEPESFKARYDLGVAYSQAERNEEAL